MDGLYATGSKPGPPRHFLVAADATTELSDDAVALIADVAQCLAPHAMMLPREGWEGHRHDQTPAALLIARYVELGGSEVVYRDRSETPSMRHWTAHHLLAPNMRLTLDSLGQPVVAGSPPLWPHTLDMAVRTMLMAPRGQRAEWPGAEHLLATGQAAQVQQPTDNNKGFGVCALMSTIGTLLPLPRPGNLLSTLDRRWVAAVVLNRDMGPIARLPSLVELPAAVLEALPAPHTPLDVADVPHHVGMPGARMPQSLAEYGRGGWADVHADDGLPAAREGHDAAAAAACPPAMGGERQAVVARGGRAPPPIRWAWRTWGS